MSWVYSQSTGFLKHNGKVVFKDGYSGKGNYKNKPAMQHIADKGPIPRGLYTIQSPRYSGVTGPYSMPLVPKGHNALGRTFFQIHGDKISDPGNASTGCIILGKTIRQKIWKSLDHTLEVVR
ncbi:tlde1 domain-containing protein [Sulfurimonas sp.]|uniref:tlde1 domain-containing protein n=1 Tax=Sulfurimonas sp. TaxID=2022749 RepID=UPI002B49533C|nr:tlde1 domain-containing protein [Sulfurimonas sp.]